MMVGRGVGIGKSRGGRRTFGVHLMPMLDAVDTPRHSIVVEIDRSRRVRSIERARTVDDIASLLGMDPSLVGVDAPLHVANEHGRRPVDELLAWLDVPVLPMSRARAERVFGGLRGEELARRMGSSVVHELVEAVPDFALRLYGWIGAGGDADADLADFRAAWLDLRPEPYRPKGVGRARPAGIAAATALIAGHVDLADWRPHGGDDWQDIDDAGTIDAIIAADCAWCIEHGHGVLVGGRTGARCALPTVRVLARRIGVNVERMARAGADLRCEPIGAA